MVVAVKRFLASLTLWSSSRDDVMAVALVGSQARETATPSSDVDVVLLVRDPQRYLSDTTWTSAFGNPIRHAIEPYGQLTSLRVWYQHQLEVEFGFGKESWPFDPGAQAVMADGLNVLLDRSLVRLRPMGLVDF